MKKLNLFILLSLAFLSASSQKIYFTYIQTESNQPFFVKIDQKVSWSSPSGYIILSRLRDSIYSFSIGFPQNKWPEQSFTMAVEKKDHGFLLKNFNDKGWGLYDFQSTQVQMASNNTESTNAVVNNNVTPFTEILANAAGDPSLKDKTARPIKEEVKTEPVPEPVKEMVLTEPTVAKIDTLVVTEEATVKKPKKKKQKDEEVIVNKTETTNAEIKPEIKSEPQSPSTAKYQASEVTKLAENTSTEGVGMIYVDNNQNGSKDTIRLVIPNPTPVVSPVKEEPKVEKKFLEINNEVKMSDPKTEDSKVVDTKPIKNRETVPDEIKSKKSKRKDKESEEKMTPEKTAVNQPNVVINEPVVVKEVPVQNNETQPVKTADQPASFKNSCPDLATEDEFVKLRKRMAGEKEDKMTIEAKKLFKIRCFSTNQVRVLGRLFETDEERYNFFDAAYRHVYNPEAFALLQSEFQDSYYSGRFKAMLRN